MGDAVMESDEVRPDRRDANSKPDATPAPPVERAAPQAGATVVMSVADPETAMDLGGFALPWYVQVGAAASVLIVVADFSGMFRSLGAFVPRLPALIQTAAAGSVPPAHAATGGLLASLKDRVTGSLPLAPGLYAVAGGELDLHGVYQTERRYHNLLSTVPDPVRVTEPCGAVTDGYVLPFAATDEVWYWVDRSSVSVSLANATPIAHVTPVDVVTCRLLVDPDGEAHIEFTGGTETAPSGPAGQRTFSARATTLYALPLSIETYDLLESGQQIPGPAARSLMLQFDDYRQDSRDAESFETAHELHVHVVPADAPGAPPAVPVVRIREDGVIEVFAGVIG